jgi:hypothetical protein
MTYLLRLLMFLAVSCTEIPRSLSSQIFSSRIRRNPRYHSLSCKSSNEPSMGCNCRFSLCTIAIFLGSVIDRWTHFRANHNVTGHKHVCYLSPLAFIPIRSQSHRAHFPGTFQAPDYGLQRWSPIQGQLQEEVSDDASYVKDLEGFCTDSRSMLFLNNVWSDDWGSTHRPDN